MALRCENCGGTDLTPLAATNLCLTCGKQNVTGPNAVTAHEDNLVGEPREPDKGDWVSVGDDLAERRAEESRVAAEKRTDEGESAKEEWELASDRVREQQTARKEAS